MCAIVLSCPGEYALIRLIANSPIILVLGARGMVAEWSKVLIDVPWPFMV